LFLFSYNQRFICAKFRTVTKSEINLRQAQAKTAPKTPVWSHRGRDFKKQAKKKVHWGSTGHETQFSSNFDAKLSLPCPFFS